MDVVLVHPEIPHNAGCAGRLTAGLGRRLHLVEPLGFSLEDRYLKRAGLDYWHLVRLVVHPDLDSCLESLAEESARPMAERLRLFSARGGKSLFDVPFEADDVLLFGSESKGLPADLMQTHGERRVQIPIGPGIRSFNLANAVAVGLFTAMNRAGVPFPALR